MHFLHLILFPALFPSSQLDMGISIDVTSSSSRELSLQAGHSSWFRPRIFPPENSGKRLRQESRPHSVFRSNQYPQVWWIHPRSKYRPAGQRQPSFGLLSRLSKTTNALLKRAPPPIHSQQAWPRNGHQIGRQDDHQTENQERQSLHDQSAYRKVMSNARKLFSVSSSKAGQRKPKTRPESPPKRFGVDVFYGMPEWFMRGSRPSRNTRPKPPPRQSSLPSSMRLNEQQQAKLHAGPSKPMRDRLRQAEQNRLSSFHQSLADERSRPDSPNFFSQPPFWLLD